MPDLFSSQNAHTLQIQETSVQNSMSNSPKAVSTDNVDADTELEYRKKQKNGMRVCSSVHTSKHG